MDIKVARGLLERMGIQIPSKSSHKKIGKKVLRAIELKGEPHDLTGDERDLLLELQGKPVASKEAVAEDDAKVGGEKGKGKRGKSSKSSSGKKEKSHRNRDGKKSGAVVFKELFEKKSVWKRCDVISSLVETGISEASAKSYICWAKRPEKGTANHANPFDFQIKSRKDEDGTKILELVK